jgi:hypothetical protein
MTRKPLSAVLAVATCAAALSVAGAAVADAAPAGSAHAQAASSWGKGMAVPGLAALNTGGDARVTSVSCASAGNCAAVGYYSAVHVGEQGFVASERNGRWGKAIEVPGLGKLDKGENAQIVTVSCGSAGNCALGGHYFTDSYKGEQGFVASERNGRWGNAIEVPGLAALNRGGYAAVASVSCTGPGNCGAGGSYSDSDHHVQAFTATSKDGRWSSATELPGLGALNTNGNAGVESLSCASAGNCAASGHYYTPGSPASLQHGFVASERDGRWSDAIQVPGLAALNTGGNADAPAVSCASAGNCVAVGYYSTADPLGEHGFVTVERNGRWGSVIASVQRVFSSVSCVPAGRCLLGGAYGDSSGTHAFVVSEYHGRLGTLVGVPSPANGAGGTLTSLSCGSAGNCAVGGNYLGPGQRFYGFVAAERNGSWGTSTETPRPGALGQTGGTRVFSVSCGPAGPCTAGGYYSQASGYVNGFVVSQGG